MKTLKVPTTKKLVERTVVVPGEVETSGFAVIEITDVSPSGCPRVRINSYWFSEESAREAADFFNNLADVIEAGNK